VVHTFFGEQHRLKVLQTSAPRVTIYTGFSDTTCGRDDRLYKRCHGGLTYMVFDKLMETSVVVGTDCKQASERNVASVRRTIL